MNNYPSTNIQYSALRY